MNSFIIGFLLGRCSKPSIKPSKETLNRHGQVKNICFAKDYIAKEIINSR